jgi:hypothetical protein
MKHKRSWLILISLSILCFACNAQVKKTNFEWKDFVSEDGQFKVKFPTTPEQSIRTSPLGNGKIQYPKIEVSLPQIYLSVYFSDIQDENSLSRDELKSYYDFIRDETIRLNNSQLISDRDILVNENVGREIVESRNDKVVTYRIFLIKNKLYQLKTEINSSLKKDNEVKEMSEKFLDSFQVIEK